MDTAKSIIEAQVKAWASLGHPALLERFLLRNGEEFVARPYTGKRGTPKACFRNAINLAMQEDLNYVEGYVIRRELPLLILHAWCAQRGSVDVIDPTLTDPEDCFYMGYRWPAGEALSSMVDSGVYGMFDHGLGPNVQLMLKIDPDLEV